ncbi:MAG: hypothetical protein U0791_14980 [Gemmataceae bacterium]
MAKNIEVRLARVEKSLEGRTRSGQFDVVQAIEVHNAEGLKPGLYPTGPPGSTAGILVYDPADGGPHMPPDRMPPWGLMIWVEGAALSTVL